MDTPAYYPVGFDTAKRPASSPAPVEKSQCACAAPTSAAPPPPSWTWTLAMVGAAVLGCSGVLLLALVFVLNTLSESRDMLRLLVQSQLGVVVSRDAA